MSSTIVIQRKICLEPEYLDKNIKTHLLNKLISSFTNECNKEHGYILKVNRIVDIKDNYISSNCEHIFILNVEIETLKPEIDKELVGTICMIFSGGIFLNVKNKLKVLVPITTLSEYTFDQANNCFINKDDENKIIKQGDELKVLISGMKYSKQNFSCFGKLIGN